MDKKKEVKTSKLLSLVLRHKPEGIDLVLDQNGWADVEELLHKVNQSQFELNLEELKTVVTQNDKKRFVFSEDQTRIRASQGHSLNIDLALTPKLPPTILYHGTALKNLESIREKGLLKGERHHVHLSDNIETALKVGQRYGKPVVLHINTQAMNQQGIIFYQSANEVWLTNHIAPEFIEFP